MDDGVQRLLRDWKEVRMEPLPEVCAEPSKDDIREWHCNLIPQSGPYAKASFHCILRFPKTYPKDPPEIEFMCDNLSHPNVFNFRGKPFICLDMLRKSGVSGLSDSAWSSAYSVHSILLQLQSFLFGENIEQDFSGPGIPKEESFLKNNASRDSIEKTLNNIRNFRCKGCPHRGDNPFPKPECNFVPPLNDHNFPPLVCDNTEDSYIDHPCRLTVLPEELLTIIAVQLLPSSLKKFEETCKETWDFCGRTHIWRLRELICFHTKTGLEDGVILGIGVTVNRYPDNQLKTISPSFDLLCYDAWKCGVRLDVSRNVLTHHLPVMLHPDHSKKAIPLLKADVFAIATNMRLLKSTPVKRYIDAVLKILPTLMNTTVVELMHKSGKGDMTRCISYRAVEGYLSIHHMLLKLTEDSRGAIAVEAERRIRFFMSDEKYQTKKWFPDIGELLCLFTISDTPLHSTVIAFLNEVFARQVRWVARDYPEILQNISGEKRIRLTLLSQKISLRLIMFQLEFLRLIGRPAGRTCQDTIAMYDRGMGASHPRLREMLYQKCKAIHRDEEVSWEKFFETVGVAMPSNELFTKKLEDSVTRSYRSGYTGRRGNSQRD